MKGKRSYQGTKHPLRLVERVHQNWSVYTVQYISYLYLTFLAILAASARLSSIHHFFFLSLLALQSRVGERGKRRKLYPIGIYEFPGLQAVLWALYVHVHAGLHHLIVPYVRQNVWDTQMSIGCGHVGLVCTVVLYKYRTLEV